MPMHVEMLTEPMTAADRAAAKQEREAWKVLEQRIAELEAALHRIDTLIDSPARFNKEIQDVLDSVIDTSDTHFQNAKSQ